MNVKINRKILDNISLSDSDLLRYNKHVLLDEINDVGQQKLLNSRVALIGLGGLGCPIAYYLTASGIGNLFIIDYDDIDLTNLQRQILFTSDDIGKNKAKIAAKKLQTLNPDIKISALNERIDHNWNSNLFENIDLIIDATDNYETRTIINKLSLSHRKPLIMGSAIKLIGQVAIFRNDLKDQPCYNCLYNIKGDNRSCLDQGILSSLTGIVGSIQATEAIKFLLNFGENLESKLMIIDIKQNEFRVVKINKDKECEYCNE